MNRYDDIQARVDRRRIKNKKMGGRVSVAIERFSSGLIKKI
ncbi:MAG TPA: hypothetical protein PKA38_01130 [Candidatus Levybacteria bacterium]|nr:hypothetical protein [Candidatus Levybacteria bacterium]